jgi:type IV pilus assembly protein PilA
MVKKTSQGFTLIELLVVIGILAILLSITLIAINPARSFGKANNTKRQSAVLQILNAIGAYQAEQKGILPTQILSLPAGTPVELGATNMPDLCPTLVPNYIPALPVDPSVTGGSDIDSAGCATAQGGNWLTGYTISRDAQNRLTIAAPSADAGDTIKVSR